MKKDYLMIDNNAALLEFCKQLQGSAWLAVDTEFEREKTYYPELCLLQVSNGDVEAIIDPLAISNLEPFLELLYDKAITKVFHAANQDLEILFHMEGAIPVPIFDTQIAAPMLGYAEQIGYANLVKQSLGVELDKGHSRTDWKRRPLSKAQLDYAIDDVIYLGQIYEQFINKLTALGRLEWLANDFSALAEPELYQPEPQKMWLKIRMANKLRGNKLAVFQQLVAWREIKARKENRPRNWLMRNEVIFDIARLLPESKDDLSLLKGLNEQVLKRHGAEILSLVHDAQQQAPAPLPTARLNKSLTLQQEATVDVLMAVVRLKAHEHQLSPVSLAPRKDLEIFVQDQTDSVLLKSWREHLIGHELKSLLSGTKSLQLVEGQLTIV